MTFFTNSKDERDLITGLTKLEVVPFDKHVPESKEVDLLLLDNDFFYVDDNPHILALNVLVIRPDRADL